MALRNFGGSVAWIGLGQAVSALAMVGMIKVWALYLEPADLGLMALIVGAGSILVGIFLQPLFQAMLVGYATHSVNGNGASFRAVSKKLVVNRTVKIAAAIMVFGSMSSWYLSLHWVASIAVAGLFVIDAIRTFDQRLFAAARRSPEVALVAAGDALFRMLFVWIFLDTLGASAYVAILGNLFGASLFVMLLRAFVPLEAFPADKDVPRLLKHEIASEMNNLAKLLLPSMVLANITAMGNRYFVGATIGLPAAGLFVASYGFVRRPYGILNNIGEMTMTPILKAAVDRGQDKETARVRFLWLTFIALFSSLGALLFYVFREELVLVFLSEKYSESADLLFGLAVAISLFNIANIFNWFSITLGDSKAVLINNFVGASATSILTIVLCLRIGLQGAIWALIVGYGLQFLASMVTYYTNFKTKQRAAN